MIDTHAHLTDAAFDDLPEILSRAHAAGVAHIVAVCESLSDAAPILSLSSQPSSPRVHAALGLHPEHVTRLSTIALAEELAHVSDLLRSEQVVAVGEVGLDHTPRVLSFASDGTAAKLAQAETFAHFLRLGRDLGLPITVHSRGAGRAALEIVADVDDAVVVMHAFDGRAVYAERALLAIPERLYFSVPPSIERSPLMQKLVARLSIERLVLESDAPALGPVKGERNEPANIGVAARRIAIVKGLPETTVCETLTANAERIFIRLGGRS